MSTPPLTSLAGFVAEGDVLGVQVAIDRGHKPLLLNPLGWPVPNELSAVTTLDMSKASDERVAIMDELVDIAGGRTLLRPPSLVVGIDLTANVSATDLLTTFTDALASAGLARSSVVFLAVAEAQATQPAITSLGLDIYSPTPHASSLTPKQSDEVELEQITLGLAGARATVRSAARAFTGGSICIVRRASAVGDAVDLRDVSAPSGAHR